MEGRKMQKEEHDQRVTGGKNDTFLKRFVWEGQHIKEWGVIINYFLCETSSQDASTFICFFWQFRLNGKPFNSSSAFDVACWQIHEWRFEASDLNKNLMDHVFKSN